MVYSDVTSCSGSQRSDYTPSKCSTELDILSPAHPTANDVIKIVQHTLHSMFGEYDHPQFKYSANNQSRTFANITKENRTNNAGSKEFPTLSKTAGVRARRRLPTNDNYSLKHSSQSSGNVEQNAWIKQTVGNNYKKTHSKITIKNKTIFFVTNLR